VASCCSSMALESVSGDTFLRDREVGLADRDDGGGRLLEPAAGHASVTTAITAMATANAKPIERAFFDQRFRRMRPKKVTSWWPGPSHFDAGSHERSPPGSVARRGRSLRSFEIPRAMHWIADFSVGSTAADDNRSASETARGDVVEFSWPSAGQHRAIRTLVRRGGAPPGERDGEGPVNQCFELAWSHPGPPLPTDAHCGRSSSQTKASCFSKRRLGRAG